MIHLHIHDATPEQYEELPWAEQYHWDDAALKAVVWKWARLGNLEVTVYRPEIRQVPLTR